MSARVLDLSADFPLLRIEDYQQTRGATMINLIAPFFDGPGCILKGFSESKIRWTPFVVRRDERPLMQHKWAQRCVSNIVTPRDVQSVAVYSVHTLLKDLKPPKERFEPFDSFVRYKISFIIGKYHQDSQKLIGTRVKKEKRVAGKEISHGEEALRHTFFGRVNAAEIAMYTVCTKYVDYIFWADTDPLAEVVFKEVLNLFWEDLAVDASADQSILRRLVDILRTKGYQKFMRKLLLDHNMAIREGMLILPKLALRKYFRDDEAALRAFYAVLDRLKTAYLKKLTALDGVIYGVIRSVASKIEDVHRLNKVALDPRASFPPLSEILKNLYGGDKIYADRYRDTVITYIKSRAKIVWPLEDEQPDYQEAISHWAYARSITADPAHAAVVVVLYFMSFYLSRKYAGKVRRYQTDKDITSCHEWLDMYVYEWWDKTIDRLIAGAKDSFLSFSVPPESITVDQRSMHLKRLKFFSPVYKSPHFPKGPSKTVATMNWAIGLILSLLCVTDTRIPQAGSFANLMLQRINHAFDGGGFNTLSRKITLAVGKNGARVSLYNQVIQRYIFGVLPTADLLSGDDIDIRTQLTTAWATLPKAVKWEDPETCRAFEARQSGLVDKILDTLHEVGASLKRIEK